MPIVGAGRRPGRHTPPAQGGRGWGLSILMPAFGFQPKPPFGLFFAFRSFSLAAVPALDFFFAVGMTGSGFGLLTKDGRLGRPSLKGSAPPGTSAARSGDASAGVVSGAAVHGGRGCGFSLRTPSS